MGIANIPVANGHAAGKNGQELGIDNEIKLLNCIKDQGWIREYEACLLIGMSPYTVGVVSRRLAQKGQLFRERVHGNAGYFLRLKLAGADRVDGKSGKDIVIPRSWMHDALAIQSLYFLAKMLNCEFETEAHMRHLVQKGKLPDGQLTSATEKYYFEQERSKKSGLSLATQANEMLKLANENVVCFLAYPYPPENTGNIDHEKIHLHAMHKRMDEVAITNPNNFKLVKCGFKSKLSFCNMHIDYFEVTTPLSSNSSVSWPQAIEHSKHDSLFKWEMSEARLWEYNGLTRLDGTLFHGDTEWCKVTIIEMQTDVQLHTCVDSEWNEFIMSIPNQSFDDFIVAQKLRLEAHVTQELKMYSM